MDLKNQALLGLKQRYDSDTAPIFTYMQVMKDYMHKTNTFLESL